MKAAPGGGLCFTCHQPTGLGLPKAHFPPLAGSERVLGDKEILIKIMMHGLMGPTKVNGKELGTLAMPPPGLPPGSLPGHQIGVDHVQATAPKTRCHGAFAGSHATRKSEHHDSHRQIVP